jgi:hypothetical protein
MRKEVLSSYFCCGVPTYGHRLMNGQRFGSIFGIATLAAVDHPAYVLHTVIEFQAVVLESDLEPAFKAELDQRVLGQL